MFRYDSFLLGMGLVSLFFLGGQRPAEAYTHAFRKHHGARFGFHVSAEGGDPRKEGPSRPATMIDQGPGEMGGFGGVLVGYAPVSGGNGLIVGGEGSLLLGRRFSIGGAGFGLVNHLSRPTPDGGRSRVGLGYGGPVLRYHLIRNFPVYPTLGTLIGFGGLSFDGNGGDAVLIIEPSAAFYMNITKWLRIGVSLSYKFTTGVDTPGLTNADFRGPCISGHLDFGMF